MAIITFVICLYFGFKVERIKKQYDVQTYREVVAFFKGETLDEIAKIRESGKRKYQKIFWVAGFGIIGLMISHIIWLILR